MDLSKPATKLSVHPQSAPEKNAKPAPLERFPHETQWCDSLWFQLFWADLTPTKTRFRSPLLKFHALHWAAQLQEPKMPQPVPAKKPEPKKEESVTKEAKRPAEETVVMEDGHERCWKKQGTKHKKYQKSDWVVEEGCPMTFLRVAHCISL